MPKPSPMPPVENPPHPISAAAKLLRWKADMLEAPKMVPAYSQSGGPGIPIVDQRDLDMAELYRHTAQLLDRSLETEKRLEVRTWLLLVLAIAIAGLVAQQVLA